MKEDISIVESLDFSLGTYDVQESKELSALRNHYIREIKNFGIDKVYFSGEFPSVYFKKVKNFVAESQQEILAIHKKVWNQGKVPFLYIESPHEVRIYNGYEKPVKFEQEDRTIEDLVIYQTSLDDLSELKNVFDKIAIETGSFWKKKKYAAKVKNEYRVEEELIKNLKKTRAILKRDLPVSIIHNLLLRSLFILYLEDRGATDIPYYKKITHLENGTSYFEILKDKTATYLLFEELEDKFNGNLSPVSEGEKSIVTNEHLLKIKECFWEEIRQGGQLRLFEDSRLFNFEIIPIQLLSEIYEEFLGAEDPNGKVKTGAFYTPHPLAEFVLNEVLPYPTKKDTRYNIKTLDPTCGSGIFLVETLNRLLDRWEVAHPKKQLDFDTIADLVKDNIFGIEINPEAIKVAAFSIYLAMLNRLNPKTLWQIKKFPYLIFDPKIEDEEKQGNNLFLTSSLTKSPLDNIELVVGNPPFSRGGLQKEEQAYLDERGYARELVLAFLDRVTTLAPNAKYGLICGSKPVLFNNGAKYQKFRQFLFNETYVEKVFNFSILRRGSKKEGGRNLFASAVSPISIIFYTKKLPKEPSEKIMYCAPKTAIKNRIIDGIAIDRTDEKYLPRIECQKSDTKIWKMAMWGTDRDFNILNNWNKKESVKTFLEQKDWKTGVGFQTHHPRNKINSNIKKIPFIPAKNIERYYSLVSNTEKINFDNFRRFGSIETYSAPHLLIKSGQKNKKFCATFLDFDCSFMSTVCGISSGKNEENSLKMLMAFLNSSLASYIMFLTSASWGVEREEVKPSEVFELPNLSYSISDKSKKRIVALIDQIISTKKNHLINEFQIMNKVEKEIEDVFWNALNLSETDQILIEDLLKYTLDAFQNKQKSIAYHPNQLGENKLYAKFLCKTINEFLDYDEDLSVWASVFEISAKIPLNVILIHFNKDKKADTILELPEKEIGQILKQMEEYSYQEYAESIYYRRFFRYSKDDRLYIIKPNEKRFWSRSMAINDADEIIAEVLNT